MKALRIYTCTYVMAQSHQLEQCHMETGEIGTKAAIVAEVGETASPSREKPGICS